MISSSNIFGLSLALQAIVPQYMDIRRVHLKKKIEIKSNKTQPMKGIEWDYFSVELFEHSNHEVNIYV